MNRMLDDIIYVKKIGERWHVWLGSLEDEDPHPAKCDAKFFDYDDADKYSSNWVKNSYVTMSMVLK